MPVSDARYALLRGWARYLAASTELNITLSEIKSLRIKDTGSSFGILVKDDHYALEYQRLDFRIKRAERAVGMGGITSHAVFDGSRFIETDRKTLDKMNHDSFHRHYRLRAYKAKKSIEAHGTRATCSVPCQKCRDEESRQMQRDLENEAMSVR